MEILLDRTLWFVLGCLIGAIAGWSMRAAREARRAADEAAMLRRELRDRDEGGSTFTSVALAVVVLLTAVAAITAGINQARVNRVVDQTEQQRGCTERVLAEVIGTLDERTVLTSDVAVADEQQNRALARVLQVFTSDTTTDTQAREALQNYARKLQRYLTALDALEERRANHPYPTRTDYTDCLQEQP